MVIRIFAVLLGLCGFGIVLCGLFETIFLSGPSSVYHVIPLKGTAAEAENTVRKALHSLKGQLIFVDVGLEPEAQVTVALFLNGRSYAKLYSSEQIQQELRWEYEFGTGTDQGNGHFGDLSK